MYSRCDDGETAGGVVADGGAGAAAGTASCSSAGALDGAAPSGVCGAAEGGAVGWWGGRKTAPPTCEASD
ncbi:UNVERIFIED_CONTAM: hypothetical protein Slati_3869900 [Sesamum latifolium]|uniref:Uncharacterized protein n=1 Tax=Sesamum latifolium TaxID=2727402 RepID=A0AAW2TL47_9LAMI